MLMEFNLTDDRRRLTLTVDGSTVAETTSIYEIDGQLYGEISRETACHQEYIASQMAIFLGAEFQRNFDPFDLKTQVQLSTEYKELFFPGRG